jgi:hypothetical protein
MNKLANLNHRQVDVLMSTIATVNIFVGFVFIFAFCLTLQSKYISCIGLSFDIYGFIFIFMSRYTRLFWTKHPIYEEIKKSEGSKAAEEWALEFEEGPLLHGLFAILLGFILQTLGATLSSSVSILS